MWLECRLCGKRFRSLEEYERHWSAAHGNYEPRVLGERIWEESSKSRDRLEEAVAELVVMGGILAPKKKRKRLEELIAKYGEEGGAEAPSL